MIANMSPKDLLMLFFPGYIAIELFRILNKRPTYDDVNVKSGISREILMSILISAGFKYAVSLIKPILPKSISDDENSIILVTFGLVLFATLLIIILSKIRFVKDIIVRLLGINPTYSIWNRMLEEGAYIELQTERQGRTVLIAGKVKAYEVEKDGHCHVVLRDYDVRDSIEQKDIPMSADLKYDQYFMFYTKDVKVLEIRTKKRFTKREKTYDYEKYLTKWRNREKDVELKLQMINEWNDNDGFSKLVRDLYRQSLNKRKEKYERKIKSKESSSWYIRKKRVALIDLATQYCKDNKLSVEKLKQLSYSFSGDSATFYQNEYGTLNGKPSIEIKKVLCVKKKDNIYIIESTANTNDFLGIKQ